MFVRFLLFLFIPAHALKQQVPNSTFCHKADESQDVFGSFRLTFDAHALSGNHTCVRPHLVFMHSEACDLHL